jgi:hypothetical protein
VNNFIGIKNKVDNFRKGLFLDPLDEPTFLTFSIDFKFETEPTNVGYGDSNLWTSPLFNNRNKWGAVSFLMSRSYAPLANSLTQFKEILRYITNQAPWYFQSIEGLDKMRNQARDTSKGWKTKDQKITIGTLEAVDLRVQELAELYNHSIYDLTYRRDIVPDNLRWFSMDIYVAEARNLRWRLPGAGGAAANALGLNSAAISTIGGAAAGISEGLGGPEFGSNIMEQFGFMKFKCRQCEFDFSESVPFSKLSIGEKPTMANNKIGIKIGWFEEEYKFGDGTRIYEDTKKTDIKNPWGNRNLGANAQNIGGLLTGLPIIGDDLERAGQGALSQLALVGGLLNPTLEAAARFINGADTWDQVLNNRINLGDRYGTGYASNGDTVPNRQGKELAGKGLDVYQDSAAPKRPPIADAYPTGYATNGDRVPPRTEIGDRNVYPDQVNLSTTPEGSVYTGESTPPTEPDDNVYSEPDAIISEPVGDVYSGPVTFPTEPDGTVYPGTVTPRAEPDGDVYPGSDPAIPPPSGDVYTGPVDITPPPSGNIYPVYNPIRQSPIGTVYETSTGPKEEPNGDVYPSTRENRTEPNQNVYPGGTAPRPEPRGDVYP